MKQLIRERQPHMTKSHQVVADYVLNHIDDVPFLSITELAWRVGVSEATLVRFSKELGFSGYPDLKDNLQKRLKDEVASSRKIESIMSEIQETESTVKQVLGNQITYLKKVIESVSDEDLDLCARWIAEAGTIYLFGDGVASVPVDSMAFWLTRFGMNVCKVEYGGRRLFDKACTIERDDAAVVFAFGRDYADVAMLFDWARRQGARTILIADVPYTHMASLADKVIVFERGPMDIFSSMAIPVAVADALVVAVTRHKGKTALEAVRKLEDLRERYGFL
ncbi:MAG TPA: MurR/RpiR family transcriptional regulator [Bacillota bacterium]|nr:MurR/RpiR family transcriptional regulator [Bacillota bacterium]